jgi:hypothetical protein
VTPSLRRHSGALLLFAAVVLVLFAPLLEAGIQRAVLYPHLDLPFVGLLENSTRPLNPARILRAAWHHRRTSACFASLRPPEFDLLSRLIGGQLPNYADDFPARALAELGFTTVIVDSSTLWGESVTRLVQDESGSGSLALLHEAPPLAAYALSAGSPAGKGW